MMNCMTDITWRNLFIPSLDWAILVTFIIELLIFKIYWESDNDNPHSLAVVEPMVALTTNYFGTLFILSCYTKLSNDYLCTKARYIVILYCNVLISSQKHCTVLMYSVQPSRGSKPNWFVVFGWGGQLLCFSSQ